MTTRTGDVIEQAARVIALTDDYDGCFERLDGTDPEEPLSTDEEDAEFWRRRARALADAGLLRQEPPTREEIARALSVIDVHHPDYCDCGQPLCGGTCDAEGEDCFCETERCDGLDQQTDASLALWEGRKR